MRRSQPPARRADHRTGEQRNAPANAAGAENWIVRVGLCSLQYSSARKAAVRTELPRVNRWRCGVFMHTSSKRLTFLFLAGFMLAGCTAASISPNSGFEKRVDHAAPIVPLIDVAQRTAELATIPENERHRWCQSSVERVYLTRKARIRGRITHQRSNAQSAGNALFANVEAYYAGKSDAARAIRNALVKGSRIDAFTVLVPYRPRGLIRYNVMNEPAFQVANFMVPLAHAYLILRKEYPGEQELIADVKRWGVELFEVTRRANDDFIGQWRGIDRRAHIAAGWASWGNAANNRTALEYAYRYYLRALTGTGKGGADLVWIDVPWTGGTRLSHVNATLQSALVAAHALHRSGVGDVYTVAPAGGTLVEGIAWFWDAYDSERPLNLGHERHTGSKGVRLGRVVPARISRASIGCGVGGLARQQTASLRQHGRRTHHVPLSPRSAAVTPTVRELTLKR